MNLLKYISIDEQRISKNSFIILAILAYLFSVIIRLIWVYQFNDYEQFKFNGQFMLNTNDGYVFAEGARDIIAGFNQLHDRSPVNEFISIFTAYTTMLTPFDLDTVTLYLPVFLSSLIVIPMVYLAKELSNSYFGLAAAIIASITWSYYNRTMIGYYDTDILNLVFPLAVIYILIKAINDNKNIYLLFLGFLLLLNEWWYLKSYSINLAILFVATVYMLYKDRKNIYFYKVIIIFIIGFIHFNVLGLSNYDYNYNIGIKAILILLLYFVFKIRYLNQFKYVLLLLAISLFIFFLAGGFDPVISKLKGYVFRDNLLNTQVTDGLKLFFYEAQNTVREAGKIPFETVANRISGSVFLFFIGTIGYVLLLVRYPILIISTPLYGIGLLSLVGGLRFTFYAVPLSALGISFIIFLIASFFRKNIIQNLVITICILIVMYPNIKHIIGYKVPTVFVKDEVRVLDRLKNIVSREDYVVTWWDYGYPIRYYSDVKTLTDGGGHTGDQNYPVSYVLTQEQQKAAKMARLEVEYAEKSFVDANYNRTTIYSIMEDYEIRDVDDFLVFLSTDFKLPQKTRDIYLYLPNRMMNIYPTISLFSNLDLKTGKSYKAPFFYKTNNFKESKDFIDLGKGIKLFKTNGMLEIQGRKIQINKFVKTFYKNNKLSYSEQAISTNSNLNVIFMSNYKQFLIVDNQVYNSLYFQLFVLERYNKELFEPVVLSPLAKVYKLKI